jgi:hypothetical protein
MEGAMVSALTGALNSLLFKLKRVKGGDQVPRERASMLERLADMEEIDAQTKE